MLADHHQSTNNTLLVTHNKNSDTAAIDQSSDPGTIHGPGYIAGHTDKTGEPLPESLIPIANIHEVS